MYIAQAIGYIDKNSADELIKECVEIASMLKGLMKYLNKDRTQKQ